MEMDKKKKENSQVVLSVNHGKIQFYCYLWWPIKGLTQIIVQTFPLMSAWSPCLSENILQHGKVSSTLQMYRRKYYVWMKRRWFFLSLPLSVFFQSFKRHDSDLITLIFDISIFNFNNTPGDSNVRSIWNNQYFDNYYIIILQSLV